MFSDLFSKLKSREIAAAARWRLHLCLDHLKRTDKNSDQHEYRETQSLLRASSCPWTPSHHAFLYGPQFRACIASLCLVKVSDIHTILLNWLLAHRCVSFPSFSLDPFVSHWEWRRRPCWCAVSPLWDVAHHHVVCSGLYWHNVTYSLVIMILISSHLSTSPCLATFLCPVRPKSKPTCDCCT